MARWRLLTFELLPDVHLLVPLLRLEVVEVQLVDLQPEVGRLRGRRHLEQKKGDIFEVKQGSPTILLVL